MPRHKSTIPSYEHHKSRQAYIRFTSGGVPRRLPGVRHPSEPSTGGSSPSWDDRSANVVARAKVGELSVNQLLLAFLKYASKVYVDRRRPSNEFKSSRGQPRSESYGLSPAKGFGPKALAR